MMKKIRFSDSDLLSHQVRIKIFLYAEQFFELVAEVERRYLVVLVIFKYHRPINMINYLPL